MPFSAFTFSVFCSNDLSQGVRSSAAAVTATEQGIRQGAQYLNLAVKEGVIPSVKSKVPAAKGTISLDKLQLNSSGLAIKALCLLLWPLPGS